MTAELHISTRLADILPPLSDEVKQRLEESIERDGRVIDPILYWHDGERNVVIDGMHRFEIIRRKEITNYRTEAVPTAGQTYEEVEEWIWNHQAGRRNMTREEIGTCYNELKTRRGGDRKSDKIKGTNGPLIGDAAQQIAKKMGVSAKTVKRDGARVKALEKLTKAAKTVAEKAPDRDVKVLAMLSPDDQNAVAHAVRVGQAASVREALKLTGAKSQSAPKASKPPKKLDRRAYYKQWDSSIGPLVRLVTKIAEGVGELNGPDHKKVKKGLSAATLAMVDWMQISDSKGKPK